MATELKHFESVNDVLAYVASEFPATLQDDVTDLEANEDDDAAEMSDKLADVESVSDLILNAADSARLVNEAIAAEHESFVGVLEHIENALTADAKETALKVVRKALARFKVDSADD